MKVQIKSNVQPTRHYCEGADCAVCAEGEEDLELIDHIESTMHIQSPLPDESPITCAEVSEMLERLADQATNPRVWRVLRALAAMVAP